MPKQSIPIPDEFIIDKQFQFYLELAYKAKWKDLPLTQYTELKRCFYMAYAIQLINMRDRMPIDDDEAAIDILEDMMKQVANFLSTEILNTIAKN